MTGETNVISRTDNHALTLWYSILPTVLLAPFQQGAKGLVDTIAFHLNEGIVPL